MIYEYNSQRNSVFRRLLFLPDPDSKAFQDNHYRSAFTDNPIKLWLGEPGVVIVCPSFADPPGPTAELREILDNFEALRKLWFAYENPCIKENCPFCRENNNGKEGNKNDLDDEDDKGNSIEDDDGNDNDGEEDSGEDGKEDSREDGEEDGGEDGEEDSGEDSEEDEKADKDVNSSRKSRKGISKRQPDSAGQHPLVLDFGVKKSTQANKHRKKRKNTERDWMMSAPYDESIPYSHRYGYTWAGTTSDDLMEMWQAYRKPVDH